MLSLIYLFKWVCKIIHLTIFWKRFVYSQSLWTFILHVSNYFPSPNYGLIFRITDQRLIKHPVYSYYIFPIYTKDNMCVLFVYNECKQDPGVWASYSATTGHAEHKRRTFVSRWRNSSCIYYKLYCKRDIFTMLAVEGIQIFRDNSI